jgi:hypothetical protein
MHAVLGCVWRGAVAGYAVCFTCTQRCGVGEGAHAKPTRLYERYSPQCWMTRRPPSKGPAPSAGDRYDGTYLDVPIALRHLKHGASLGLTTVCAA